MRKNLQAMLLALALTGMLAWTFNHQQAWSSSPPGIEWDRTYGGTHNDYAFSVVQTPDGGYAIAGYTNSFGPDSPDFWLVKTDEYGDPEWSKIYGGPSGEKAYCVVQTADGGYAIAGRTRSFGSGKCDIWLVKTDEFGNHLWNQTYGGPEDDIAREIIETSDGGYAMAGETSSFGHGSRDFWLVKTDSEGNMQWNQPYGGTDEDEAYSVVQTEEGGYAVVGRTLSFGPQDFWLVKTDADGNMQWNRAYGGGGPQIAFSVVQTPDGGYAIGGENGPNNDRRDVWLVKTDASGDMQWNKTYGVGTIDISKSMIQTADGGYALAGWSETPAGSDYADFYVIKTDVDGNMQWNNTYGGAERDEAYSLIPTSDGGYAVVGYTGSFGAGGHDFWLIKLAPEEIPATVDIDPDTLNLKSNGQWITTYLELPEESSVSEIDVSSILLNGSISVDLDAPTAIGDHDTDSIPDLMVKFERAAVIALLGTHDYGEDTGKSVDVALVITGEVAGTPFEGNDTIRILLKS